MPHKSPSIQEAAGGHCFEDEQIQSSVNIIHIRKTLKVQPGGGDTPGTCVSTAGGSVATLMANLHPQANLGLVTGSQGVYIGEGLPPVPTKLTAKIKRGKFIKMVELSPEFWSSMWEDDHSKQEGKSQRARSVQDIFT